VEQLTLREKCFVWLPVGGWPLICVEWHWLQRPAVLVFHVELPTLAP